ncbi:baseplate wedge subunit [Citrobacter phage Merlin]|uniref:Baseplate wedge subunit and tail pin n=1 Tax=Citrobacter phage Merlin TaxID=1675602 RepID=A0A0K1LNQ6_9CAUD|nr:baseplate wedge subunit [Citrobacter phage Merlin]AKU43828.1 baseplate wedge subunit and tail pin [Citrobacter phage Merlin]
MSLLNNKAGVVSRLADYLQFNTTQNNDVMNKQPYGSITITQLAKGVEYSNIQSAIQDIRSFSIRPINSIEINTDGISPEGVSQTDQWTFTGTVARQDGETSDCIISVFGFNVLVSVGDTAEEVKAKAKLVLEDAVTNNFVVNTVADGTNGNELVVTYIDNQSHNLKPLSSYGITVSSTTLTPGKEGYGVWNRIGTKTETLEGLTDPVLLHYFKRIA